MIKVLNDHVALKPLVFDHDKGQATQTVKGFVGTDKLSKTLITSEVVFTSKSFSDGQKVYLRAEVYNAPQAKNIMKIGDIEFILLPESLVVATETQAKDRPSPLPPSSNGDQR